MEYPVARRRKMRSEKTRLLFSRRPRSEKQKFEQSRSGETSSQNVSRCLCAKAQSAEDLESMGTGEAGKGQTFEDVACQRCNPCLEKSPVHRHAIRKLFENVLVCGRREALWLKIPSTLRPGTSVTCSPKIGGNQGSLGPGKACHPPCLPTSNTILFRPQGTICSTANEESSFR